MPEFVDDHEDEIVPLDLDPDQWWCFWGYSYCPESPLMRMLWVMTCFALRYFEKYRPVRFIHTKTLGSRSHEERHEERHDDGRKETIRGKTSLVRKGKKMQRIPFLATAAAVTVKMTPSKLACPITVKRNENARRPSWIWIDCQSIKSLVRINGTVLLSMLLTVRNFCIFLVRFERERTRTDVWWDLHRLLLVVCWRDLVRPFLSNASPRLYALTNIA